MTFPPHFYNRQNRRYHRYHHTDVHHVDDGDTATTGAAATTQPPGCVPGGDGDGFRFVSLGSGDSVGRDHIDNSHDNGDQQRVRTVSDDTPTMMEFVATNISSNSTSSGLTVNLFRPRAVSGEVLKGAKLLAGISSTVVSKDDMDSLVMSTSIKDHSITGTGGECGSGGGDGAKKMQETTVQSKGLEEESIMVRVSPAPATPTFGSITTVTRLHRNDQSNSSHHHVRNDDEFMVHTTKSFESISPLPSREEEEEVVVEDSSMTYKDRVGRGLLDDEEGGRQQTGDASSATSVVAVPRTIAPTASPFDGYHRHHHQQQQQALLKPESVALVTPDIGLQKTIISTSTSQQLEGQDGTHSPPYFPSSYSLISSSSLRYDGHHQQVGRPVGSSPFAFPPGNMLSAMSFSTVPPSHFRPTMMPCGPRKNLHQSAPSMKAEANEDSRHLKHSGCHVNTNFPVRINAPIKKRKFHPIESGAGPKTHTKLTTKKKTIAPKKHASHVSTRTVTTTKPLPKTGIEAVKTDADNGCPSNKKFSWKRYPLLEKFLISNREEYLSYSARNYTSEQKEYNNKLTARVLTMAKGFGYTDLTNPEIFTFSTVRDKIRCYYKSYVQSSKRRGDGSPLDKYYEQHRREKLGLQQSKQKRRRKDRARDVSTEGKTKQSGSSQGLLKNH